MVEILRTRALIAEITLSLTRLCDLVANQVGSPAGPEPADVVAAATS